MPTSACNFPVFIENTRESTIRIATFAVITNLILFCGLFLLATPGYNAVANDDPMMMMFASGIVTGSPEEHLIYSNIVIGKMLKYLYEISNLVNWYTLYLYGTHFIAMIALLFTLARRFSIAIGLCCFLILFFVFETPFLLGLQFTSTAVVATLCGFVILLFGQVSSKKGHAAWLILGVVAVALGAMIRFEAFCLVLMLLAPTILLKLWNVRSKRRIYVGLIMSCLAVLTGFLYDSHTYSKDEHWDRYRETNRLRGALENSQGQLFLNRISDGSVSAEPFLKRVGWSKNDVRMYLRWFLADNRTFSKEKYELVFEEAGRQKRYDERLASLRNLDRWQALLNVRRLLALLFIQIAVILLAAAPTSWPRRFISFGLATATLAAGICGYFFWVGERLPDRVLVPVICTVNVALLFLGIEEVYRIIGRFSLRGLWRSLPRTSKLCMYGLLFFFGVLAFRQYGEAADLSQANRRSQAIYKQEVEKLVGLSGQGQREHIFVFVCPAFPFEWMNPFSAGEELRKLKQIHLGPTSPSPVYHETLKRYSIKDVYTALYERKDVYMVGRPSRLGVLVEFVREHYRENIDFEIVAKPIRAPELDAPYFPYVVARFFKNNQPFDDQLISGS